MPVAHALSEAPKKDHSCLLAAVVPAFLGPWLCPSNLFLHLHLPLSSLSVSSWHSPLRVRLFLEGHQTLDYRPPAPAWARITTHANYTLLCKDPTYKHWGLRLQRTLWGHDLAHSRGPQGDRQLSYTRCEERDLGEPMSGGPFVWTPSCEDTPTALKGQSAESVDAPPKTVQFQRTLFLTCSIKISF